MIKQAHFYYFAILMVTTICCKIPSDRNLVWADEFEQSGMSDKTKWSYDLGDDCPEPGWR